jgi:hypothetical protein
MSAPLFRDLELCKCTPGVWHGDDTPAEELGQVELALCENCGLPLLAVSLSLLMDRYQACPSANLGSMLEELDAKIRDPRGDLAIWEVHGIHPGGPTIRRVCTAAGQTLRVHTEGFRSVDIKLIKREPSAERVLLGSLLVWAAKWNNDGNLSGAVVDVDLQALCDRVFKHIEGLK